MATRKQLKDLAILRLREADALSRKLSFANKALFTNWSIATLWKPERRYDVVGTACRSDVEDILKAIRDKPNGVLTWIKKHW